MQEEEEPEEEEKQEEEEEPEEEEEEEEEEAFAETPRDTEVHKQDTAPVKTEKEGNLVTLVAWTVELELLVQNLEHLIAKAQEDKEQSKEELTVEIQKKKGEVRVWKYRVAQCFKQLKKVTKKLKNIRKKKSETLQAGVSMSEQD